MTTDARHTAFQILIRIRKKAVTLDTAIDQSETALRKLSQRDRNLCHAIVHGVLRTQGALDWVVVHCSDRDIRSIDPQVLYLIRIALFQIMYMDRIPVSAAVNTVVDMARAEKKEKTCGFINAVLRRAAREYKTIVFPDMDSNPALHLSVTRSLPMWLVRRWLDRYTAEHTISLCDSITAIPSITLRTNTLKTDRDSLIRQMKDQTDTIEPTWFSDLGIRITGPVQPIQEMTSFNEGGFQIQDEAAQLVTQLLDPKPGQRTLDACAGLGGKTGHLAQLMGNTGTITALDTDARRLDKLSIAMGRLGITMVTGIQTDLLDTSPQQLNGYFDNILLDAPCSGLGVLKRNPDSRWTKTLQDILRMASRQKKLLAHAANLVKPGGMILYTVCSCEPEENQMVIEKFLSKRKDYVLCTSWPEHVQKRIERFVRSPGYFCTYPFPEQMDGFFAALLQRRDR